MKIRFFALLPLLLISLDSFAQHAYFQIGGGYAFPTSTNNAGEMITFGNNYASTISNIRNEKGSGIPLMVRMGYMITNFVGADIGFNYLIGKNSTLAQLTANNQTGTISAQVRQARLNPAIVFTTNREMILSAYSRLGLVLPLGGVTNSRTDLPPLFSGNNANTTYTIETRDRFGVGYSGTLGAQYRVYERMFVFAEVEAIHLALQRRSDRVTSFEINGQNRIDQLGRYELETRYVNELNQSSNSPRTNPSTDNNRPEDALTSTTFYNSVGMNIGIKYRIY